MLTKTMWLWLLIAAGASAALTVLGIVLSIEVLWFIGSPSLAILVPNVLVQWRFEKRERERHEKFWKG